MKSRLSLTLGVVLLLGTAAADDKKELEKLAGTWNVTAIEVEGKSVPADKIKSSTLTMKGDKYTFKVGDDTIEGVWKIDASGKPKTIDAKRTNGKDKDQTLLGIYLLEGDELKTCFSAPGKEERPKDFSAKEGSGQRLYVFQRAK